MLQVKGTQYQKQNGQISSQPKVVCSLKCIFEKLRSTRKSKMLQPQLQLYAFGLCSLLILLFCHQLRIVLNILEVDAAVTLVGEEDCEDPVGIVGGKLETG